MRVVCINDNWIPCPESIGLPCPGIGDKDTVTDTIEESGIKWYKLQRFGPLRGFLPSHFVEIDESELEVTKEKQLQTA